MRPGEGPRPDDVTVDVRVRRVAVFVDYWWVYSSARHLYGGPQPSAWFGNVSVGALARLLVKRPPAAVRRSERQLAGTHVFIRGYDPELHHGQHERVQRWEAEGATVDVGPSRETGGFWQSALSVSLAAAVTDTLVAGTYDTAVVFAGDSALLPLLTRFAGTDAPSTRIELATWVAPDGAVPTSLAATAGVWCHRLGESTFRQLMDDRRSARITAAKARRAATTAKRRAGKPNTAMAAALAAAGLGTAEPSPPPAPQALQPQAPSPPPQRVGDDEEPGKVRRLTQRLFGRSV